MPIPDWFFREGGVLAGDFATRLLDGANEHLPPDTRLGAFAIEREIGRGGQAVVYLAHRADGAYQQHVAIKLALAQAQRGDFSRERQLLAELKHPHLARLIDGGEHAGRPWFAMDFVDGPSIDRHCTEQRLPRARRIALFLQVCAAVSFAHQRLLVHRDIKPSNVLVDADDTPRLLDFGIAALLTRDGVDDARPAYTPAFASPEQKRGESVGPASDQYQLALLLRRMLLDAPSAATAMPTSTLATAVMSPGAAVAENTSSSSPTKDEDDFDDDLRAILAQAQQDAPEARYGSVAEFADDLRRYLAHQPVRARRHTPWYLLRCLARRHPWRLAAGVLAFLGVVAMLSFFTWRLARERDISRAEAARAEATKDFLIALFRDGDPTRGSDPNITARELMQAGAARVEADTDLPTDVRDELVRLLADVQMHLGDATAAAELIGKLSPGQISPDELAEFQGRLAMIRGEPKEAVRLLMQATALHDTAKRQLLLARSQSDAGETQAAMARLSRLLEHDATLTDGVASSAWIDRGVMHWRDGKPVEAIADFDRALARIRASDTAITPVAVQINKGLALIDLARFDDALAQLAEAERDLARFPNFKHQYLIMQNRGMALLRKGEVNAARDVWQQLLELVDQGVNPGIEASTVHNLAAVDDRLGDPVGSIAFSLRAQRLREALGDAPAALSSHINVLAKLYSLGMAREVQDMANRAVERAQAMSRPDLAARARLAGVHGLCATTPASCVAALQASAREFAEQNNQVKYLEVLEKIANYAFEYRDQAGLERAARDFAQATSKAPTADTEATLRVLEALCDRDIERLRALAETSTVARRALVLMALDRGDIKTARAQLALMPEELTDRYWLLRERVARGIGDAKDAELARDTRDSARARVKALLDAADTAPLPAAKSPAAP